MGGTCSAAPPAPPERRIERRPPPRPASSRIAPMPWRNAQAIFGKSNNINVLTPCPHVGTPSCPPYNSPQPPPHRPHHQRPPQHPLPVRRQRRRSGKRQAPDHRLRPRRPADHDLHRQRRRVGSPNPPFPASITDGGFREPTLRAQLEYQRRFFVRHAFQSMGVSLTISIFSSLNESRKSTMISHGHRADGAIIPSKPINAAASAISCVRS